MIPQMIAPIARFLQCEDGPTTVEYAVMVALIVTVCLSAIWSTGQASRETFHTIAVTTSAS